MTTGYTATVNGSLVQIIPQTSSGNNAVAQSLLTGIGTINGGLQINGNTLTPSSTLTTSGRVVIGVGASTPFNAGRIDLGTLQPNVVAVLINNTNTTTLATTTNSGQVSVVAGAGGLTLVDNGNFDVFNVGGGSNSATLNGIGGTFEGGGNNRIVLNNANKFNVASTIVGYSSSDTIVGTSGNDGGLVYMDGGGTALINPTAGNVTVIGGTGAETVFGGAAALSGGVMTAAPFTGTLTVVNGTGYFAGGTAGNNSLTSSTVGGTTLVGGGNNDVLKSYGPYDRVAAGTGINTIDGSNSPGGNAYFGNSAGGTLMYGSKSIQDSFFLANSTFGRVGFSGAFVSMHTSPGSPTLYNLNTTVGNALDLGYLTGGLGVLNASVHDFISGVDWINVAGYSPGTTVNLDYHSTSHFFTMTTSTGAVIDFFNTSTMTANDIRPAVPGVALTITTTTDRL